MREFNFFSSFEVALKIHYIRQNFIRQNLISNRLVIFSRSLLFYFLMDF
jgi:hypothetical protein